MTNALLIIDYTNDFVATDGALTAGAPAQAIDEAIVTAADRTLAEGGWVYLPTDLHVAGDQFHPETKLFPPHNELNTWGRDYYGRTGDWFSQHQDQERVNAFAKTRYSSFAGTTLDIWLRERNVRDLELVGVCTDICVLHTAVDAYNLGYHITINANATATFTPGGQEWALNHFRSVLGATII